MTPPPQRPVSNPIPIPPQPQFPPATPPRRPAAPVTAGPSIQPEDVTYALFRHKWKILLCTILGVIGGAVAWWMAPKDFTSEAKVMIRYVVESRTAGSIDPEDRVVTPDARNNSMVGGEIELFRSGDLAAEVVAAVGATNILRGLGDGDSPTAALVAVRERTVLSVVPSTSIISVRYTHPDPGVARDVVRALVDRYQRLHAKVHGSTEQLDDLARQNDRKRSAVQNLETELQALKAELDLTLPLGEAQSQLASLQASLTSEILAVEASLAEAKASLPAGYLASLASTNNTASSTNTAPANGSTPEATAVAVTNALPPVLTPIDPAVAQQYDALNTRLSTLRSREQVLLGQYLPTSQFVRPVMEQIAEVLRERETLIAAHPALTNRVVASATAGAGGGLAGAPTVVIDPVVREREATVAKIIAMEAKLATLRKQREDSHTRARLLADKETTLLQIERRLEDASKQYEYFTTALERARADEAVANSRLANISVVETASNAFPAATKIKKIALGFLAGGPAAGLGLAFLLEFFADPTLRRRKQIVDRLKLPLMLTVPRLKEAKKTETSTALATVGPDGTSSTTLADSVWGPYAEALRDRLIMQFQIREMHHKPKMIGVTGCGKHAGVTTVATALAASLSETGEGKVLYVDVNPAQGASVHPFQEGRAVARIQDALTPDQRQTAMVNDQLYAVSLGGQTGGRVGVIPRTISELVPKIRASDYDYIIFDLPPISQTSVTARVAGLLDLNVLVLESEKTLQGRAEQAVRLLSESRSDVVAVLNKHRRYLPTKLDADL